MVWQPVRSAGSNETSLEVACRGEVLDALVLTGEREQVAQMPNSRQEEQERRHESAVSGLGNTPGIQAY